MLAEPLDRGVEEITLFTETEAGKVGDAALRTGLIKWAERHSGHPSLSGYLFAELGVITVSQKNTNFFIASFIIYGDLLKSWYFNCQSGG